MIPSDSSIATKIPSDACTYFITHSTSCFKLADEFVLLKTTFEKESVLEQCMVWFEMVSPLINLFLCYLQSESPSMFTMLSFQKLFVKWKDWVRYKELQTEIVQWKEWVRFVGGPFISTNDSLYHTFVYADGMERLRRSFFGFTEKGAKRL